MNRAHPVPKSRSQLKREEDERQEIAFRFVSLGLNQIDQLPLEDGVRDAIRAAATDLTHVPKRRAKLRVAGLLRDVPLEELREIVSRIEHGEPIRNEGRERLVDAWVESLLSDESAAIDHLLLAVPDVEVGRLRQLLRNVRKEQDARSPGSEEAPDRAPFGERMGKAEHTLREYLTELRPSSEVRSGSSSGSSSSPGSGSNAG
ncbi:MAG: ribosome biogenesis factor YjgA [Candidatus Eisenbacteria bacterium]